MDPFLTSVVSNLVADGIVAAMRWFRDAESDPFEDFSRGAFDSDPNVQSAVELACGRLSQVEAIDPRLGGDNLRGFLSSRECQEIVRSVFVLEIGSSSSSLTEARKTFRASLCHWIGSDVESTESDRVFDILVRVSTAALRHATDAGYLGASDANANLRHRLVLEQITNLEHSVRLLGDAAAVPTAETLDSFEAACKTQIASREGFIVPPHLDRGDKKPIDDLFVEPSIFETEGDSSDDEIDLLSVLARSGRCVILGDPGGGKTTLTQKIAFTLASNANRTTVDGLQLPSIAFRVVLRDYAAVKDKHSCSILQFIEKTLESNHQLPEVPSGSVEYFLRSGRAAVLFDGLDELIETARRREISLDVESFSTYFSTTPILVTSRRVGYDEAPLSSERFRKFQLGKLRPEKVREYAEKWFGLDDQIDDPEALAESFMRESNGVDDLRSNPLLLGLMCNIYRGETYIPSNRPDVYEKCAVMLFDRWDKDRGIRQRLSFESRLRPAMQHLAYWIYQSEKLQQGVTEKELVDETTEYLANTRFENKEEARAAAREFIELCRGRAWVFTDTGSNASGERLFQFTHRTFLEYFTAEHLVRSHETVEDFCNFLKPRISRNEWDMVAQLGVQLKSRQFEGACDQIFTSLLLRSKTEKEAMQVNRASFCARSLRFLVPSPKVTRAVVDRILELDFSLDGHAEYEVPGMDQDRMSPPGRFLGVLGEAGPETHETVISEVCANLIPRLGTDDEVSAVELGLNLSFFVGSGRARASRHAWEAAAVEFAQSQIGTLQGLAESNPYIASDLVVLGVLPVGDMLRWHGLLSAFASRPYERSPNTSRVPIANISLRHFLFGETRNHGIGLGGTGATVNELAAAIRKANLKTTKISASHGVFTFQETNLGQSRSGVLEKKDWNESAKLLAFVLMAGSAEGGKRSTRAYPQGDPVFDQLQRVVENRGNAPSSVASQIAKYFSTDEDRAIAQSWCEGRIGFAHERPRPLPTGARRRGGRTDRPTAK